MITAYKDKWSSEVSLILVTKVLTFLGTQKVLEQIQTAPEDVTVQVIDITRLFGVTTKTKYHTLVQIITCISASLRVLLLQLPKSQVCPQ